MVRSRRRGILLPPGGYLGDGTINVQKGVWLQVVNDRRYPGISQEILAAMANLSGNIRRTFAEHCELLGIRVTQSNYRNLTISHRHSVAIIEQIVGPKT